MASSIITTIVCKLLEDEDFSEISTDEDESRLPSNFLCESTSSDTSTDSVIPRRRLHRVENYINVIENYDEEEFKEHFRMKRCTADFIIGEIKKDKILAEHKFGRETISVERAFYMTVWYLGNTETFRQLSDKFDVTKSSAHRIISKIINYLVDRSPKYIVWPDEERKKIIRQGFYKKQGIDHIIGVIDGSHIKIKKPNTRHAHVYYNRHGYCSILLQGVCDHEKKFIDVFCGEAGSIHDARLLKKSSLYEKGYNGMFRDDFLLGDSAYPALDWLVPPFKDNGNLSENQKIFNYRHSSTRIVIENSFGLLKGRFRRLKFFENENIIFIVKCVVAATVLHNICLNFNDEGESQPHNDEDDAEDFLTHISGILPSNSRREQIYKKMFPDC